ncbi:MAG: hypothetical protein ACLTS9_03405 [Sutterella wadsworthensis]|jgi:hypothetical protein
MLVQCAVDPGYRKIDYDPKALKQPLRKSGNAVRKIARKMISRKAVSEAGQFPGKQTGEMAKSIKVKVSKSGYSVAVYPTKTQAMPAYYPAFVVYGHRAPYSETAQEARSHKQRAGKKVAAPRKNFVPEAADKYAKTFESEMFDALGDAIK